MPLMTEIEESVKSDLYKYYFKKLVTGFQFSTYDKSGLQLGLERTTRDIESFIFDFTFFYKDNSKSVNQCIEKAESDLLQYIKESKDYEIESDIVLEDIMADKRMYQLLGSSWIGERIKLLTNLKHLIVQKHKDTDLDLTCLI
ncbi:MAG: hypothetical protein ABF868_11615 [Sporolactobacillus sp.]